MIITSTSNERIKELSKLNIKKYRDKQKLFLVEGDHLVSEAYKSGHLKEIYILDGFDIDIADVTKYYVTKEVLKKLSNQITSTNMVGVCTFIEEKINPDSNIVILDKVQDPGNLGTIVRSAAAFNYNLVIGDGSVDIYNDKVVRSTEGMIFHVNFVFDNTALFISKHPEYNYFVADMNKGENVKDINVKYPFAIVMGNEGNGISDSIRNLNMNYVHIKQSKVCESLNVGVAASIIMHELGDINE